MKYNKIIIAKSYKEYYDLCKEKWNNVSQHKEDIYNGTEVTYQIRTPDKAREIIKECDDGNLKDILYFFINNYTKITKDVVNKEGVLEGILLTHEDYYYMLYNKKEDKIWYDTCCNSLTFKD